jgi:tetratricopeptide (TPR) repeat protein
MAGGRVVKRIVRVACVLGLTVALTAGAALAKERGSDLANAGLDALNAHDYAKAVDLFSAAIHSGDLKGGDEEYAYVERGQAYLSSKQYGLAQADFKHALELKPDDRDAQVGLDIADKRVNLADVAPMKKSDWLPAPVLDPPSLGDAAPLALPARFCSPQQRNSYYDATYMPAKTASNADVAAASAYLERLDVLIDKYKADIAYSGLKAEWAKWRAIYDDRFAKSQAIGRQFDALMAVPIGCG